MKNEINGSDCLKLGDIYRLGIGVERNFETAWQYYSKYYSDSEFKDVLYDITIDGFRLKDVILYNSECNIDELEACGIPAEWWEFVMTHIRGSASLFCKMASLYEHNSERWIYWAKKAADGGKVLYMMQILDVTQTLDEKQKYITAILEAQYTMENDWIIEKTARKTIVGDFPEILKKKAALTLFHNGCLTQKDMANKSFSDILESALIDDDLELL